MPRQIAAASPALAPFLDRRVDDLCQHIAKAMRSGDVAAIHQARVTTRRLKAALDLFEPLLPERSRRQFARTLRRMRRLLGPSRDVDVMLAHLPELRGRGALPDALDWLERRLMARRAELARERAKLAKISQVLEELGSWVPLARRIERAQGEARALLAGLAPRLLEQFTAQSTRIAELDLERACEAASDVHALRVSGKVLRYSLELCAPAGIPLPKTVLSKFKRLQDALGLWHDYAAMGEQVLEFALDEEIAMHRPALYGEVLELARRCWRKSNAHLHRFADIWKRDGNALAQAITVALEPPVEAEHGPAAPDPQPVALAETASTST